MVTLDWDLERTDGVTLVRAYVTAERPRRVRVANRLDGPVWPPRRRGRPAPGWDDDEFEGIATPADRLVVGYATPARPDDPPVAVVSDEPAAEPDTDQSSSFGSGPSSPDQASTPAGVVRSLGDPVVPRDAVPIPDADSPPDDASGETAAPLGSSRDGSDGRHPPANADDGRASPDADGSSSSEAACDRPILGSDGHSLPGPGRCPSPGADGRPETGSGDATALVVPGAVRDWIRDVDRRLAAADRQRDGGGPDPALTTAVAADERALEHVARRLEELRTRAAGLDCRDLTRERTAGER